MMIELFFIAMIIACVTTFVVTLMHKWGFIEYMQVNADNFPEVVNKLFSCDFCLSWWSSVIICISVAIVTFNLYILLCPFVATPIAKFLLR